MNKITSLEGHLLEKKNDYSALCPDLSQILYDISLASKLIRKEVIIAGLKDVKESGQTNIHGESVKTLDLFANDCLKQILSAHGNFSYLGSEEEDEIVAVDNGKKGSYSIFFDPLDGSSNCDVNINVGTIFSVYKAPTPNDTFNLESGAKQVAAGYVLYGSSVMLVYTAGAGVYGFTYHPEIGDFVLSHDNIKIPEKAPYYSINESLEPLLSDSLQTQLSDYKDKEKFKLSSRYVGSFVADFHRNLLKGGIFMYPATQSSPKGKLRLMYEANPMAFICEQAGGAATDGRGRILDVHPTDIHQRVPLFIGSKDLVESIPEQ